MPPSGYSPQAIKGSLQFIQTCYEDLLREVRSGKHATYEEAIQFELGQIERALTALHIDEQGNITKKGV